MTSVLKIAAAGLALGVMTLTASPAALAQDAPARPSPNGESYTFAVSGVGECQIVFLPYEAGADFGVTTTRCEELSDTGSWRIPDEGLVSISIESPIETLVWMDECQAWPVIAPGETVINPCWLTPMGGEFIHVLRVD
ncbi:MAG: hypothetical protein CMH90_03465 [Oceanicaulis sp.]|uniref:hypothetical protein n=1 Tax=Oceanicaulis sp. UBA2681 TaxID=1947007 RepID=UPI000C0AE102|nr:hypothetical protein [Oceanicaulis sp. UBA2681]MAP48519.1 hypothetical protein [Oceanicaulis sp.]HCR65422.1 hypothetical protein [Oceanicaulis sp.]